VRNFAEMHGTNAFDFMLTPFREHLKSHHKPPQCERCYRIFEDVTQRTEHHKRAEICVQNGVELKEGIDDGQWQRIEALLKKSKKEPTREIKDQVEKWFEIWEVVFPNTPRPQDPCEFLGLDILQMY
jgi:hypothetical protein